MALLPHQGRGVKEREEAGAACDRRVGVREEPAQRHGGGGRGEAAANSRAVERRPYLRCGGGVVIMVLQGGVDLQSEAPQRVRSGASASQLPGQRLVPPRGSVGVTHSRVWRQSPRPQTAQPREAPPPLRNPQTTVAPVRVPTPLPIHRLNCANVPARWTLIRGVASEQAALRRAGS